jgi:hypothetical protein
VLINEVYKGPGKQLLSLVPLVFFAGFIPQVVSLGYKTANDLTQWENHREHRQLALSDVRD